MGELAVERFEATFGRDYSVVKQIGKGGYGVVFAVKKRATGQMFALKRLAQVFAMPIVGRRALREIKVLRHLRGHENIVFLHEVLRPDEPMYQEVYIVQEFMPSDLSKIIHSKQPLTEEHFKYFLYQILRGLKFIHSAGVMHRDLKPSNLLINEACDLKICDFGLARGVGEGEFSQAAGFMSEYVATRWYRAPEIMFSFDGYSKAVDVWSVGCILGEMLWRKPMFPGDNYVHQLKVILAMMGTPPKTYFERIASESTRKFLLSLPFVCKTPLPTVFPAASAEALDLLDRMLEWVPEKRITAVEALQHPFLAAYHNASEEPTCPLFDPRFENDVQDEPSLRAMLSREADFDRIRWAQLAEARRLVELQEERKRQELEQQRLQQQLEQQRQQQMAIQKQQQEQQQQLLLQQQHLYQQQQHQLLLLQQQQQFEQQRQLQQQAQRKIDASSLFTEPDIVMPTSPITISSGSGSGGAAGGGGGGGSTNSGVLSWNDLDSSSKMSAPTSASWRNLMSPNARLNLTTVTGDGSHASEVLRMPDDQLLYGDASFLLSHSDWPSPKPEYYSQGQQQHDLQAAITSDAFLPVENAQSEVVFDGAQLMEMDVVEHFLSWSGQHARPNPADPNALFQFIESDLAGFRRA